MVKGGRDYNTKAHIHGGVRMVSGSELLRNKELADERKARAIRILESVSDSTSWCRALSITSDECLRDGYPDGWERIAITTGEDPDLIDILRSVPATFEDLRSGTHKHTRNKALLLLSWCPNNIDQPTSTAEAQ